MALALDITPRGNSMTLASARLPGAELDSLSLDTPVSRDPLSMLQLIAAQSLLTLEESRLPGFEALSQ